MASSILFSNSDRSVVLIDIPRSIEEAQHLHPAHSASLRLLSCKPQAQPWLTPEPKGAKAIGNSLQSSHVASPASVIAELMTLESVRTALYEVKKAYSGPWCLPRLITRGLNKQSGEDKEGAGPASSYEERGDNNSHVDENTIKKNQTADLTSSSRQADQHTLIPENARYVLGSIALQRPFFVQQAPSFELIILDPPWPSRSVRRKRKQKAGGDKENDKYNDDSSYTTAHSIDELRSLLLQIPVASHLKPNGLVAVWVTNKAAATDLLTRPGTGILAQWGLELVGEWTWLKITSAGEPVVQLESQWRKPWERLLIAQRVGDGAGAGAPSNAPPSLPVSLRRRTILGVPDLHSRKPNLRGLFRDVWPEGYSGLEVFARNLTAGWWAWGDDVLCFQNERHWVVAKGADSGQEVEETS